MTSMSATLNVLEAAYEEMWRVHAAGERPRHIQVQP